MGIFSDTCQELINPETGRALAGPALAAAKADPAWPRCGHKVKKAARFCSKCGGGAPRGWWKCPSCGKWVGNDSQFCWSCKTELRPDERLQFAGGVWDKPAGLFAQRFEVGDLARLVKEGLCVQTGTEALLLDGGRLKGRLEAGRHNPDSLLRKINHWGDPPPRSAVLVDSGDFILPVRFGDLRTAEELAIEFYGELIVAFDPKRSEDFLANCLRQARSVSYQDILDRLEGELRHAVAAMCDAATVEDLVKDPERRMRLDALVEDTAGAALQRLGLKLVRTSSAEFVSPEYEKLRGQMGEVEAKRREIEFTQKLRDLLGSDKMHEFKSEHELSEYVAQLAQEKDVSAAKRDHELGMLLQVQGQRMQAQQADFAMAEEMKKTGHEIGVAGQWKDFKRGQALADARTELEIHTLKTDVAVEESEKWLRIKELKRKLKREDAAASQRIEIEGLAAKAKVFEGRDIATLVMLESDPVRREQLLRLQEQQQRAGMSTEQILASVADRSPEAARALAEMSARTHDDLEREFAERKRLADEQAAQTERMFNKAMDVAADAARHRGNSDVKIISPR